MPIIQYIYIDLRCVFCVCITVKIQSDNTSSVAMRPRAFEPPLLKNSGSAPVNMCQHLKKNIFGVILYMFHCYNKNTNNNNSSINNQEIKLRFLT